MSRTGVLERLLAVASVLVAALVAVNLAFSFAQPHPAVIVDPAAMRILLGGAVMACLFAAWRLWSGGGQASTGAGIAGSPLFGRHAAPPVAQARANRLLIFVPIVALAVAGVDFYERGATSPPGQEAESPGQTPPADIAEVPPAEPPAVPAEPKPPELAVEPKPAVPVAPSEPPEDVAAAPPPEVIAPKPAEPLPEVPIAPSEPPPDVAVAPPPATVAPPVPPAPELPSMPEGHRDAVVWLDVSPDGRYLLSASTDRTIKLWDVAERRLISTLGEQKDMARTALFLPDGKSAITCGDDGEIVLRALKDGTILHVFDGRSHGGANKLALSADGRIAVSGHEAGTVIVWDLNAKSALHVMKGHDWTVSGVAVSRDGTRAVSGDIDGVLKLWDLTKGTLLRGWRGHERGVYGAVFTADGRQLVTGSGDYTIKQWDLETGKEIRRFDGHSGTVYALALSDDGRRLLSSSLDGTARLWDFEASRELAAFDPMTGPIYSVVFGPGGEIVTGGYDRSIRFWPPAGGAMMAMMPGAKP